MDEIVVMTGLTRDGGASGSSGSGSSGGSGVGRGAGVESSSGKSKGKSSQNGTGSSSGSGSGSGSGSSSGSGSGSGKSSHSENDHEPDPDPDHTPLLDPSAQPSDPTPPLLTAPPPSMLFPDLVALFAMQGNDYLPKIRGITMARALKIYGKVLQMLPKQRRYLMDTQRGSFNFLALYQFMRLLKHGSEGKVGGTAWGDRDLCGLDHIFF